MLKTSKQELSFIKEVKAICLILICIVLVATFCIFNYSLRQLKNEKNNKIEKYGELIVNYLRDDLSSLENLLKVFSKYISKEETIDFNNISFDKNTNIYKLLDNNNILSWSLVNIVSPERKIVYNLVHGKLEHQVDVSNREYISELENQPWKLIFSRPRIGEISHQNVLPAGIGITNLNNDFIGSIILGISIDKIKNRIATFTASEGIEYIIINSNNEIITQSFVLDLDKANELQVMLSYQNSSSNLSSNTFNTLEINNLVFSHIKKIEGYPFYIITGLDSNKALTQTIKKIIPSVIEITIIGISSILAIYIMLIKILRPINLLAKSATLISEGKYIDVPMGRYKELNNLSEAINSIKTIKLKLLETLKLAESSKRDTEKANEIVNSINYSLEQRVSERTKELVSALASKTEFLNNMSHEIRTPIHGFTSISLGLVEHWNEFDENKRFELAKKIAVNSERLSKLLGHLLDLSKYSDGKILLIYEEFDLAELAKAIINEVKELTIDNKIHDFTLSTEGDANLFADKERIAQVLRNLLFNAVKFSPSNSTITIKVSETNIHSNPLINSLKCSVTDQGIGIPEGETKSIFEPFVQSSKTKTKAGGTGLGLAITKNIIECHHGTVSAHNNISSPGATFNFIIPKSNANKEPDNSEGITSSYKDSEISILAIDDEDTCLTSIELFVFGSNIKLTKALGGQNGLEQIMALGNSINVILLDLMMPDVYGLNVLATLKNDERTAKIPVILVTGSSDDTEIEKACELGIFSYIKKPFKKEQIINEISKAFASTFSNK